MGVGKWFGVSGFQNAIRSGSRAGFRQAICATIKALAAAATNTKKASWWAKLHFAEDSIIKENACGHSAAASVFRSTYENPDHSLPESVAGTSLFFIFAANVLPSLLLSSPAFLSPA